MELIKEEYMKLKDAYKDEIDCLIFLMNFK